MEWLENDAIVNGLSLFVSVIIPIIVMIFTLKSEKKRSKEAGEISEKQFKDSFNENERQHKESLMIQKENNRVSQMPYVYLKQDIKIGMRNGYNIFPLVITNIGNGVAIDVKVRHYAEKDMDGYPYVYKQYGKSYRYTNYLFTNVLQVNGEASFELLLDMSENDEEKVTNDKNVAGEVQFTLVYKDSYYNEYEQSYSFLYHTKMGIERVETKLPVLIKEYNQA